MSPLRFDVPQRSPEWFQLRLGKLTGSSAADMLATVRTKGVEAAARRNLRVRLMLERITGRSQEAEYQSLAMQRGIQLEPDAFAAYEAMSGQIANQVGFLQHPELMAGCSLDGYVGDTTQGIIEIKCPLAATHLEAVITRRVPGDYLKQITHNLWITGAEWADWVSYCPDFPERIQTVCVHVEAKDIDLDAYDGLVREFLAEVDSEERRVRALVA